MNRVSDASLSGAIYDPVADTDMNSGKDTMLYEEQAARRTVLLKRALGCLLLLCCLITAETQAVHPGAYVCAVDNCKKDYRKQSESLFEACRDGAAYAADSEPASAACMQMCKTNHQDGAAHDACATGCALYPKHCLRFGELPPKDNYLRDSLRPESRY